MHENSDNADALEPRIKKTLTILEQKARLVQMFHDVGSICEALISQAKRNPTSVKASLLKEVVNSLKVLKDITEFSAEVDRELKRADEISDSPDGLTREERDREVEFMRIMAEIEESERQYGKPASVPRDPALDNLEFKGGLE